MNDWGREAGPHGQGKVDQIAAALLVRDNPGHAFVAEDIDNIGKQPDRFEQTMRHYRHHDVELEVSVCTCPGNARVVADHLSANHHDRFAHYGVDFARHD